MLNYCLFVGDYYEDLVYLYDVGIFLNLLQLGFYFKYVYEKY